MIQGHPFLYRAMGGTVYGEKGDYEAKGFLIRREVQFIVVASPKGAYEKWTK